MAIRFGVPAIDGVGQDRRVEPEMGVRRPQEPEEVDVLDQRDRPVARSHRPCQPLEKLAVRAVVALARVLLEDDVDAGQRAAETRLEHVDEVRPADERQMQRRDDEHPRLVGDAELPSRGRALRRRYRARPVPAVSRSRRGEPPTVTSPGS